MKITEESMKNPNENPAPEPPKMPEDQPSEREKLKSMSRKDRIWYIWAYYKFHIIGVLAGIAVLCVIGTSLYQNSFHTAFYCLFLNNRSAEELDTMPLDQGFAEYLGLGKKDRLVTESMYISFDGGANDFGYASMAKVTALVASKDLDAIIGDRDSLDHYASLGGFADLETVLPEDLLSQVRDRLVYVPGSDGAEHAYGLSLAGTAFAEDSHLAQDPPIFGIISNSTRTDTAVALLHYIFDQEDGRPASGQEPENIGWFRQ